MIVLLKIIMPNYTKKNQVRKKLQRQYIIFYKELCSLNTLRLEVYCHNVGIVAVDSSVMSPVFFFFSNVLFNTNVPSDEISLDFCATFLVVATYMYNGCS